ncbi:MAG: hypothetical protein GWN99_14970 [Gemmatimonadetes bacterium]|uniref:BIG2 domain-containing protein n=1 Tax=Candidatus Kutchimonas denitrificans TaxID=3056748 RepID=A0AAE4ZC32_9BACT|nr:hypothetical protein [Gemmatimonadota bacterium]NIR76326.1 hypothetical protein [Candidatus Kutchimonas denitrificans]NIS02349.1 hypothetical protein [Gemmatimonadota bacterium]NIT68168.1 hypothetical protein [Gemmatimonadota bacterium]NIU54392.1 hypothetical protein [Gemmatimonadota bacterium]
MEFKGKIAWLALTVAVIGAACDDDPVGVDGDVTFEIEIEPQGAWIHPDQAVALTATVFRHDPTGGGGVGVTTQVDSAVSWSSSDLGVATVDADGLVRAVGLGEATITARAAGVSADVLIAVTAADFPDVRGNWTGQYRPTSCTLSGATDPFFCTDLFADGASLIIELDLDQLGERVSGTLLQGTLSGFVEGTMNAQGVLSLTGDAGGEAFGTRTTIVDWGTALVGDSLLGGWQFLVEDLSGSGFGSADVSAELRLLGEGVLQFFGCPVEVELSLGMESAGALGSGDCQLDDASYFDVYGLDGAAGDSIEVVMRSSQIDAFLLVSDLDEIVLGTDNDSGGGVNGTDAAITVVFDVPATVLIIANSLAELEIGDYSLTATGLNPGAPSGSAPLVQVPRPEDVPAVRVMTAGVVKAPPRPGNLSATGARIRRAPDRSIKR